MDGIAKIYLYQMQQNKDIIEECFENENSNNNILKMSKNVKDLKINTFDIYEYLKIFKLYPYTGYSLFYTKKDNSAIALINVFKNLFGYYTYNIIAKWNIVKINMYLDVVSTTPNIIKLTKSVAESIFQYSTLDKKYLTNNIEIINNNQQYEKKR